MSEYIPSPEELAGAPFENALPAPPLRRVAAAAGASDGRIDELPPHSIEAEQAVLGCCLLEPSTALDLCGERFGKAAATVFYDLRHQLLYGRLVEMWEASTAIDLITVQEYLRVRDELQRVGGLAYIAGLQDRPSSASMIEYYLAILLEKHTARLLVNFGHDVARYARETEDLPGFLAQVQTQALVISEGGIRTEIKSIGPMLKTFVELLEKRKLGRQQITGLKTGLHMFDNMTCGLQRGEMTVIAARPSVGKTAMGVTQAIEALRNGHKAMFFSLEMGEQALITRFVGSVARVDSLKMRNGFVSKPDEVRLVKACEEMAGWRGRLFIDDRSAITGRDLFTTTRRAIRDHGVEMIVVDYLQLMNSVRQHGTREGEVGEVADWIKRTAKDLNIVVVALAQTNKESEKDRNPREPRMSDIRESDRICQNADVVGLLCRSWTTRTTRT